MGQQRQKLTQVQRDQVAVAVRSALVEAGDGGISKQQARSIARAQLGFDCSKWEFTKAMFKTRYRTRGDRYYLIGKGPRSDNHSAPSRKANPNTSEESAEEETTTLTGNFLVSVKSANATRKFKNVKKIILITSVFLAIVGTWYFQPYWESVLLPVAKLLRLA